MKTLSVPNFKEYQHYKDRSPPWIKLYNKTLSNYQFTKLPDASRYHLIAIWLLASRTGNEIPRDPEWISQQIGATEVVDLELLIEAGFLVENQLLPQAEQVASRSIADRSRKWGPEKEERQSQRQSAYQEGDESKILS